MRENPSYRLIAAAVILIAYFAVAGILMAKALNADHAIANWDQIIVVFNAVGALATTASGVLFGAEIQQANVRSAQQDSQAHAAEAARLRETTVAALENLEPGAAASHEDGAARARVALLRALSGGGTPS